MYVSRVPYVGRSTAFANIRLIIFALPIFRAHDNYEFFADAFAGYKSDPPILIMDQGQKQQQHTVH